MGEAVEQQQQLEMDPGDEQNENLEGGGQEPLEGVDKPDEGGGEKAKVEFTPEQQEFIDTKIIGEKVGKLRAAEREAEEVRRQLEERDKKLAELQQTDRPTVPPLPDPFEDNYEAKMEARDKALQEAAAYDRDQAAQQQWQEQQAQEEQRKAAEALGKRQETYFGRGESLGIKPDELIQAGQAMAQFGMPEVIAGHILDDERGPEVAMYLAKNVAEMDAVRQMNPMQAAVHIETVIKPKAKRDPVDPPPPPPDNPSGQGYPEGQRGPEGATYE